LNVPIKVIFFAWISWNLRPFTMVCWKLLKNDAEKRDVESTQQVEFCKGGVITGLATPKYWMQERVQPKRQTGASGPYAEREGGWIRRNTWR